MTQTLFPSLYYKDKRAALAWLERVFGFEIAMVVTNADGALGHCEMKCGADGAVVNIESEWERFTKSPSSLGGANSCSIGCRIEDVDAHFARAKAAGARIFTEPKTEFYGWRAYSAFDCDGHLWRFSEVVKDMSLEEMETASAGRKVRKAL